MHNYVPIRTKTIFTFLAQLIAVFWILRTRVMVLAPGMKRKGKELIELFGSRQLAHDTEEPRLTGIIVIKATPGRYNEQNMLLIFKH